MTHHSLAHYLSAVGVAALLEIGTRWKDGLCQYGLDIEEMAVKIEAALMDNKLLPPLESEHPLWCNRGRRSLARGVSSAAEWLKQDKNEDARQSELRALLRGAEPLTPSVPAKGAKTTDGSQMNPNWNLGTLMPSVIVAGGNPNAPASAWLPILAWEAQRMILTREMITRTATGSHADDIYSWAAPEWSEPLTVAELFTLLNGGLSRWHWTGQPSEILQIRFYHLRDTTGAGKTLEFCRGNEVLYWHPSFAGVTQ